MSKLNKKDLKRDTVKSNTFHVGIELELKAPCDESIGEHDHVSCDSNQREYLDELGTRDILRNYLGLSFNDARSVQSYFDIDSWIDDYMSDWTCEDSDCPFTSQNDDETVRDEIESELKDITGNRSIKVVADSSIDTNSDQVDAEVCWNYYASKETVADNALIMKKLRQLGCEFDKSCGLHINLNDYLKINKAGSIPTAKLDFLFNFVAPSRRQSNYCNHFGISTNAKYSMIYIQNDRLEFRFFSPTLDPEKLNHYVRLAHTVYKRLCGVDTKLPKKTMNYLLDKMVNVNGVDKKVAMDSIKKVNSLKSYLELSDINNNVPF